MGPPPHLSFSEWSRRASNLTSFVGQFAGWKGDFKGFFLGLRANNNKAWFDAHRRQYEDDVKAPLVALLADLEAEFGPPHRISRPNRDIRFSADKSPYKLNIYADCERGGYVALDAEGLVAAGGRYMVDDAQLKRLREATAADRSGKELVARVAALPSACLHRIRRTTRAPTCCGTSAFSTGGAGRPSRGSRQPGRGRGWRKCGVPAPT